MQYKYEPEYLATLREIGYFDRRLRHNYNIYPEF